MDCCERKAPAVEASVHFFRWQVQKSGEMALLDELERRLSKSVSILFIVITLEPRVE